MLNTNFSSLMPDSILRPHRSAFIGEVNAFPPALISLAGLQAAAAGWMNLRGHAAWGNHHCWWLTQEVERGRGMNIQELIQLWDSSLHFNRANRTAWLESLIQDSARVLPNIYHTTVAPLMEFLSDYQRALEVSHLSAFHTNYYNSHLAEIWSHIKTLEGLLNKRAYEWGYNIALRHPMVTPNQNHGELLTQDGDNLVRLLYKVPALSSNLHAHLWQGLDLEIYGRHSPHPCLFEEGAFGPESNELHRAYNEWMRFNAYATVVHIERPHAEPYGAVHSDLIHPVLLHNTMNMVSIPMEVNSGVGIHDTAAVYFPVIKGAGEVDVPTTISTRLTILLRGVSLLCQLMTAFSNGKKGARGTPKTRWSSSPANITWGKTLLAITPFLIQELDQ